MDVSLNEQIVQWFPRNMHGWRMFRIEYGGHAEACNTEGTLWLPPNVDPYKFEKVLRNYCKEKRTVRP